MRRAALPPPTIITQPLYTIGFFCLIGLFHCWDYTSPRGVPMWAESAAIFVGVASFLTALMTRGILPFRPLIYSLFFGLFYTAVAFLPPRPPINYFLGDLALFSIIPALIWMLVNNTQPRTTLTYLVPFCAVAAVIAPAFEDFWQLGNAYRRGRFDPPASLLIAFFSVMALHARFTSQRWAASVGYLTVVALCFLSQERTALLSCFIALGLSAMSLLRSKVLLTLALTAGTVIVVFAVTSLSEEFLIGRFSLLASGIDHSLLNRAWEAYDVLEHLETGNKIHWLIGYGHGAVFQSVWAETILNMNDSGKIHNIHIGPFLILFRYGIIGLLISVVFIYFIARFSVINIFSLSKISSEGRVDNLIFCISAILLILEFNIRNVLNDPLAWCVILSAVSLAKHQQARSKGVRQEIIA